MADAKPSGAPRPHPAVRRSTTPSGVTHIREYQPERYTIIGNHLAQHRELSLTAIGVGTHVLSLPEGVSVDIRTLAERFPEGRDRIAFALRELEAHGYIKRVRERTAEGRVITRTYAYHAPALTRVREQPSTALDQPAPSGRPAPSETVEPVAPAGPGPAAPPVAAEPVEPSAGSVREEPAEVLPPPAPAAPVGPAAPAPPEPARSEYHDKAVSLLIGLRVTDYRLTLSRRDVERLVPLVIPWFENGLRRSAVVYALTYDLPPHVRSPAGFLARRLREQLPPPLPAAPLPEAPPAPAQPGAEQPRIFRPLPFVDCAGTCNRVLRAAEPGAMCGRCREDRERQARQAAVLGSGTAA